MRAMTASAAQSNDCQTRYHSVELVRPPLSFRDAFQSAHAQLAALAATARGPGVALAAVDGSGRVLDLALLHHDEALVIGRHSRCALRLDAPEVSLRHCAVHVRVEPMTGRPLLRLWDLATGGAFRIEDGSAAVSVITDGPLYAAIGEYAFVMLPIGTAGRGPDWTELAPLDAWSSLSTRTFPERKVVPRPRAGRRSCTVTSLPSVSFLGERDGLPPWGELTVEHGAARRIHLVSAEALERGILVGRYDRCGLQLDDGHDRVSRVHLLLVRVDAEVWAIDTSSTNGSYVRGEPFESARLDDGDVAHLGNACRVTWRRHAGG